MTISEAPGTLADVLTDVHARQAQAEPRRYAFHFTGSGREYCRIWLMHMLLSLVTLGIYSAWAKVRRLEYFSRNTLLAGASFDFHGKPRAVLSGRVLAMLLLVLYQTVAGWSLLGALAMTALLLLTLPWLLRSALRFRVSNTCWRGLRFHFGGSTLAAYRAYLPLLAILLLPGVIAALLGRLPQSALLLLTLCVAWPLALATVKRYQYGHLRYGDQRASTTLPAKKFFVIYGQALLVGVLLLLLVGVVMFVVALIMASTARAIDQTEQMVLSVMLMLAILLIGYLLFGPYLQVRILNLCLQRTRFADVHFVSTLSARQYTKLQLKNLLLTIGTLGLYRPFAVVSAYRYRLAHLMLETEAGFEHILADVHQSSGASGDAAADFFNIDLSW